MTNVRKLASAVAAGCLGAAVVAAIPPAAAHADPAGHQVTYTITTTGNLTGNLRYISSDPPSQAAFDANSAQFMTTVPTTFSGGEALVYNASLTNPNQWAFIAASGSCRWPDCSSGAIAEIKCEIAVDGQVLVTQQATTAVTCATRPW